MCCEDRDVKVSHHIDEKMMERIKMNIFMVTTVVEKSINWQAPSVEDSEISVEDYRAMVNKAENSGYMSNEIHRRKLNEWFDETICRK